MARTILESIGQEGQKTRKYYQRRLPSDPSKDYYFIHRLTGTTQPVLIEYGFIDNNNDLRKLKNNLLTYGEAVVRAVADYTNTPYKVPGDIESNIYVVQRGDTLYSIANKFNITVDEIKAANNLSSNILNVGQQLLIPSIPQPPQSNEYIIYIVKKGDSLYSIAREYNITVDDLIRFNQLSSSSLSIGQQLLIPLGEQNVVVGDYYIIAPGDSLYSLASKYNTTVDQIIKANNLTSTVLQVGQEIIIPNYTNGSNTDDNNNSSQNMNTYIVQSGDSLYSIAKRYNVTVNEIKELNGLTSNLLMIGQVLALPISSENQTYYVQSGDSLYSIARRYDTTVNEIKKLNNLTSELLSIGQVLLIPV